MATPKHPKVFPPLESDPDLFTILLHNLGCSPALHFEDVLSLPDSSPQQQQALAYVLIAPSPPDYDHQLETEGVRRLAAMSEQDKRRADTEIIWLPQRIHNACGFYALLHCILNIPNASAHLAPQSFLGRVLAAHTRAERQVIVEQSEELDREYIPVALRGQTAVDEDWAVEPTNHYVGFVRGGQGGRVWELNGARSGAVDLGEGSLAEVIRRRVDGLGEGYGLLALVET